MYWDTEVSRAVPAESDSPPTWSTSVPARTAIAVVGEFSPAAATVTLQDVASEPAPGTRPSEARETTTTEARTIRPAGYSERHKNIADKAAATAQRAET